MNLVNETGLTVLAAPAEEAPGTAVSVLVKATFDLVQDGPARLAAKQRPVSAELPHMDDIGRSTAWPSDRPAFKPFTDFIILGSFHQPQGLPRPEGIAGFAFGPLAKQLRIRGPRTAVRTPGGPWRVGAPRPFATLPLRWEYSAGGMSDPRNPFGLGQDAEVAPDGSEIVSMPMIEDPDHPHHTPADRHRPANFAPVPQGFAERQARFGTRDRRWALFRAPLPPRDYDPAFHNAAPAGQLAGNQPRGDEAIRLLNLHPQAPEFTAALPGIRPVVAARLDGPAGSTAGFVAMRLDTVVVLPDENQLVLLWRGLVTLPDPDTAVAEVEVVALPIAEPAPDLPAAMLARVPVPEPPPPPPPPAEDPLAARAAALAGALAQIKGMATNPALPADVKAMVAAADDPLVLQARLQERMDAMVAELRARYPDAPFPTASAPGA